MYIPTILSWDERLATGDRDLDMQHKYLIEICNDLAVAIQKKSGAKIINMVLDVLSFYANSHFKKEEECMYRYKCVMAKHNQKAHALFLQQIQKYRAEFSTTEAADELALRIHRFFSTWIIHHIMQVDTHIYTAIHHKPRPAASQLTSPLH